MSLRFSRSWRLSAQGLSIRWQRQKPQFLYRPYASRREPEWIAYCSLSIWFLAIFGARRRRRGRRVRIMPRFGLSTARPVEYFILVEPHADGPVVGYYAGRPIPAAVVDYF